MRVGMTEIRVISDAEVSYDRYDSGSFIARGGFAEVYRGILDSGSTDIHVALKFYKPIRSLSCLSEEGNRDEEESLHHSFQYEAEVMSLLADSDFVVRLYGVQYDMHNICTVLVMEQAVCTLCELLYKNNLGESGLAPAAWSPKQPVSLASKLSIMVDAARGIEHTHACNISHNDIKPDNYLFFTSGHLKLTDFGLASSITTADLTPNHQHSPSRHSRKSPKTTQKKSNASESNEQSNLSLGSLPKVIRKGNAIYQPPELFVAPARYTTACDVYAFGILLNEALTQVKPFQFSIATMLPMQICGGARPHPLYGEEELKDSKGGTGEGGDNARRPRSDEPTKRLRHLIRTCWDGNSKDRPLSSSVSKILAKVLDMVGGDRRDEYITLVDPSSS